MSWKIFFRVVFATFWTLRAVYSREDRGRAGRCTGGAARPGGPYAEKVA